MQGIRASEDRCKSLNSRTHNVIFGLLRGQRDASCLSMAAHHPGTWVFSSVTLTHQSSPQSPPGTEFGNLLKEVIVYIKEKRETWGKFIDLQATCQCGIHVSQTVGNGKG